MKKTISEVLRMLLCVAIVPALSLGLFSCDPESGVGGGNESGSDDAISEIAVTGSVKDFGCTYADITGYANLNLLPISSGIPAIGVEIVEASAEDGSNARRSTTVSLAGNNFTVSFHDLSPDTKYKYRSFVAYGGITYYGNKYKSFTTKEVVNITSTSKASEVTRKSAVISASVQTETADSREPVNIGIAWSASRAAICADGDFESSKVSVKEVHNGLYSVTLSDLLEGTTYYYAAFTELGGVQVFSSVKEFTTEVFVHKAGDAIDLGLSVKWANYNVGAESPEDYGYYYAWGETAIKSSYTEYNSVTYGLSTSELRSLGIIGFDGHLTAAYDAATVNWGKPWRMPTFDEIKELIYSCTWKWTTQKGIEGYKVTGSNGNFIFLPAAGSRYDTSLYDEGELGSHWSATPSYFAGCAYNLLFDSVDYDWYDGYGCYRGRTVRPVSE